MDGIDLVRPRYLTLPKRVLLSHVWRSYVQALIRAAGAGGEDIIHAHYAVPHATAAYLAKQILSMTTDLKVPKVITTLHGTDVTLIGGDSSYTETVAFCIDQQLFKEETFRSLICVFFCC